MKIRIIQSCAVKGERLSKGARLAVGTDISEADSRQLQLMGRAVLVQEKKQRFPKKTTATTDD